MNQSKHLPDSEVRLSDIDLNLMVALDALLETSSVTNAAKRVGLTQSAMSHALKRLRLLLDDALLVRSGSAMQLTPRALEMQLPVRRGLLELQHALRSPSSFDPSSARRKFVIVTSDFFELDLLPALVVALMEEAPGIDLRVRPSEPHRYNESLEKGDADVAIWVSMGESKHVVRQELFRDSFACLVREGHPEIEGEMTLDQYVEWPHALISPREQRGSIVATLLSELGLKRRVMVEVPRFLAAPSLIAQSDLILTLPKRMALRFSQTHPLQLIEPPLSIPCFGMYLMWHDRYQKDPAHQWFRDLIVRVIGEVSSALPGWKNKKRKNTQ